MAVIGAVGLEPTSSRVRDVDPAIAAHEARHCAAAMLLGLKVKEARADNPSPAAAGHVVLGPYSELRPQECGIMTLAGRWGDPGWPPESPSKRGRTGDERQLADEVETVGRGRAGYVDLLADAKRLVERPDFKSLAETLELLLAAGCVLREDQLDQVHEVCGMPELSHKTLSATARTTTDLGEFSAIAAAYSLDRDGEKIRPGAFANTIKAWRQRNRPIPLHWAHRGDAQYVIGTVDPQSAREILDGLFVKGKLDLEGSELAREAWRLVKANTVGLSFGFLAEMDGNEIVNVDLYEISLTPAPANPDTRILNYKSTDLGEPELEPAPVFTPEQERIRDQERDRMLNLLGGAERSDPIEREDARQTRELRAKCDQLTLEVALGFDPELVALARA